MINAFENNGLSYDYLISRSGIIGRQILKLCRFINEKDELKFDQWLDDCIKATVGFPGLTKISCYRCYQPINNTECAKYLVFHEFDNKESLEAFSNSPVYTEIDEKLKIDWLSKPGFRVVWQAWYERILFMERD